MLLPIQIQAVAVGMFAVLSAFIAKLIEEHLLVALSLPPALVWPLVFCALCAAWVLFSVRVVSAHGYQVLVRTWCSNTASLREGSFLLLFPEYVVHDREQFGPWMQRNRLPAIGQTLEIDVPEVLVPVNQGVYCLKVNTKVIGTVERYSVDDLLQNPTSIEHRCHDVIANALRSAVYDKPLEEALAEVQRIFLKDADGISKLFSVPTFKATQLLLDADQRVCPADEATGQAFHLLVQRKQESAKRCAVEAAMETEEQKVKLAEVALQASRNEFMLQQEAYGKEGAALIEAAKHTKALYLFHGAGLNASTVLTLPA